MTEFEDNSKKFETLRAEYKTFVYENFFIEEIDQGLKISFEFTCGGIKFMPYQLFFKKDFFTSPLRSDTTPFYSEELKTLAFNLGLAELISYWKAACPPEIIIKCGYLDEVQRQFWKKLWFNGLGEFFYLNNIKTDFDSFVNIQCASDVKYNKFALQCTDDYIVPVGGGKDSVVTLDMLYGAGKKITPMVINQRKATLQCIEQAGYGTEDTIEVKRIIDKNLLELNKQGYLNGHTPFSAVLAFSTLVCAFLSNKKYIALSNENSANEATDKKSGANHQYSKSLEFENDFRTYYKEYICNDIEYFSFLRPISELKIAQIFSYLDYSEEFKSCNAGSKQDIWCGNCPKCLFAYIILSPFINNGYLEMIFGKNLLDDINLLNYFKELTGESEVKPFECVGTVDEVNMALCEAIRKKSFLTYYTLIKHYVKTPAYEKYKNLDFDEFINRRDKNHNLPEDLKDCFDNFYYLVNKTQLAHQLRNEKIAVMGLGREGISTLKLLNDILPKKQLILYDENKEKFTQIKDLTKNHRIFWSKDDLTLINKESTLIFLTPGMAPKDYPQLDFKKLTNQCSEFLHRFYDQCIGVTGTKGKSTTASLIHHILKDNNIDTVLAGNIGVPFFDILPQIRYNTQIVLELSCHQLQLINLAPHISVLLNLYEEHLDHYKDFKDYQDAKLNIFSRQFWSNYKIYNADDSIVSTRLKTEIAQEQYLYWDLMKSCAGDSFSSDESDENSFGTTLMPPSNYMDLDPTLCIGFKLSGYKWRESEFLKGDHNKYNILAAVNAVKPLGISEEDAIKSALSFKPLTHRMEKFAVFNGVTYFDDSISTIPQATLAAVKAIGNVSVLILGGMDRGIDYSPLKQLLNCGDKTPYNFAFVGKAGLRIYNLLNQDGVLSDKNSKYSVLITDNWKEIAEFCKAKATENSSVLLSPAASSYDQFKNFEHRGDYFKDLVNQINK